MVPPTLFIREVKELKNILECDVVDKAPEKEAIAATILISRLDQILFDAGKLVEA